MFNFTVMQQSVQLSHTSTTLVASAVSARAFSMKSHQGSIVNSQQEVEVAASGQPREAPRTRSEAG